MTTKRELLGQALEELGMAEYIFDATPEELQSGLTRLNRIAAQWDGKRIRVGFNLGGGLDAESGIPDTAENCFALNLAVQWGPSFGKLVSMETKVAAKNALNDLMVANLTIPQVPNPSGLPRGTGNRAGVLSRQYFQTGDEVTGVNDGALEY